MSTDLKTGTHSRLIVVLAVAAFGAATLLATGCNTVKGVGKDIETAGDKTQKAINNE
jgi:predicted small secreted protein